MPRVAIVSASGGCGRSTVTAALASLATRAGTPSIAIDWDPSDQLSMHLGAGEPPADGLARQIARGREAVALEASDGTLVLPYGILDAIALQDMERRLTADPDWLRARIDELEVSPASWIFIDTPRWPSVHARQAVRAADAVMVLMQADAIGLDCAVPLAQVLARGRSICAVNLFEPAREHLGVHLGRLQARLGSDLCATPVRRDDALTEALAVRASVFDRSPLSHAATDLEALYRWMCERLSTTQPLQSSREGD